MEIKAVILDFRDTIMDIKPTFKARDNEVISFFRENKLGLTKREIDANLDRARRTMVERLAGKPRVYDFDMQLGEFIRLSKVSLTKAQSRELSDRFHEAFYANLKLYKDAIPTLKSLASNYKVGLVIDGTPEVEYMVINRLKIAKFFDMVVISEEVGHGKITGIPLKKCIEGLGVKPQQTMVIGDRIDKDIIPANRTGAIPVRLIRKTGRYSSTEPKNRLERAKFTIHDLNGLNKILSREKNKHAKVRNSAHAAR